MFIERKIDFRMVYITITIRIFNMDYTLIYNTINNFTVKTQDDYQHMINNLKEQTKKYESEFGLYILYYTDENREIITYDEFSKNTSYNFIWKSKYPELLKDNHHQNDMKYSKHIFKYATLHLEYKKYLENSFNQNNQNNQNYNFLKYLNYIPYSCTYKTLDLGNGKYKMIDNTYKEIQNQTLSLRQHLELEMDNSINQINHSYIYFLKMPEFIINISK
jgi:hypothetical protein